MTADLENQSAFPKSQKPVKLREVRLEDYAQIAALASKFDLHIESYAGWAHLWTDNPAYFEVKEKLPMGWVLENSEGAISGYLGNIPLNYELDGKRLLAATTRAWVVDTPYRGYSTLLLATYFQQPNVDLFLNTTLNPLSARAYSIFEGVRVPVGKWDRTLFWITHHQGFLESFLRKRHAAIAKPLSYPLSVGLYLYDELRRSRFPENTAGAAVAGCSCFDDRFDAFWEAQRQRKYNVLLAVRSRRALEWHFKFALREKAAWIYLVEGISGLAAYSVFLRHDYPPIGLTRMRLADFQCLDQEKEFDFLSAMLQAAVERCKRESIQMLELVGLPPALEKRLERACPYRRTLPNWLFFYKAKDPALVQKLKNEAVWEPSLFDGDSTL